MKKKLILLLIAICLICCIFVGCNDKSNDAVVDGDNQQNENVDGSDENVDGDIESPNDNDNSSEDGKNSGNEEEDTNKGDSSKDDDNSSNDGNNVEGNVPDTIACEHKNCVIMNYKKESCEEDGYSGDLYCTDCQKNVKNGDKVNKIGHDYIAHICNNCGDFLIIGKYTGDIVNNIIYDVYGQRDEYLEYKELTVGENDAQLMHFKKNIHDDLFYYTIDSINGNCIIDYYDSKKDDIDSIDAAGFIFDGNAYKRIKQHIEGDWRVTVTEFLTLGNEGIGSQITTTEKTRVQNGTYLYENGYLTAYFGEEVFKKSLNFSNDTFSDEDKALCVKYYINDRYAGYVYFEDYTNVDSYTSGSPDDGIFEWYIDTECNNIFDQTDFDVKDHKNNHDFLCLYAYKKYHNTFVFNGKSYVYSDADYQKILTFEDVTKKILQDQNIEICTDNFECKWISNGKVVDTFDIPTLEYPLINDCIYTLTIVAKSGYLTISIEDIDSLKTNVYFVEREVIKETYLCDILVDVLQIPNADFVNFSYSYIADQFDYKDSVGAVAFTENYVLNDKLTIYRSYSGITVTYISLDSTLVDNVSAGEEYTILNTNNVAIWYGINGTVITEYQVNDVINFEESTVLYSSICVVNAYNESDTLVKNIIPLMHDSEIHFATVEQIFEEYQFCGYLINDKVVLNEKEYLGHINEFKDIFEVKTEGKFEIFSVYKMITTLKPTKDESGKKVCEQYIGATFVKEEEEIPVLSKNNYEYTIKKASLFEDGVEIFSSSEFGVYEIIIPKLSTYTFVYNDQEIMITIGSENECDLIIDGAISHCGAIINYDAKSIAISKSSIEDTIEYLYAVSINIDLKSFDFVSINNVDDLRLVDLEQTSVGSGNFYSYENNGNLYVAMAEGLILDTAYNNVFENLESYGDYKYVAQKNDLAYSISFTLIDNEYSMWVALSIENTESSLPQGNVNFDNHDFQLVTAYQQNEKVLTLNKDGTFTYGEESGKYYYDENEQLYVLYREILEKNEVFVYEIKNGEDVFYQIN